MEHILIIEDHLDSRVLIRRFLHKAGYQVTLAESAAEGFACLKNERIDLILLDIQLPDMSGMEVLALLKEQPNSPPVVMLTASAGEQAKAFALGARDYLLKPFIKSEMLARVSSVLNAQRQLRELNTLNQALQAERQLAGQVQRLFLPLAKQAKDSALQMDFAYLPIETVSGDVLDFQEFDNGKYLFYLGDVSGHGVHAALLMAALKSHLDNLFQSGEYRPWHLMHELATHMAPLLERHYVTLLMGYLDSHSGELVICNAGHPPALLLRKGQALVLDAPKSGAMPIGVQAPEDFNLAMQTHWQLCPGDRLLLYSDGLFEHNQAQSSGFSTLQQLAAVRADLNPHDLCNQLPELLKGSGFKDDVSLLVLGLEQLSLQRSVSGSLTEVEKMMYELSAWLQRQDFAELYCQKVGLAWLEYGNNLVHHGQVAWIGLEATLQTDSLELRIRDVGPAWELPLKSEAVDPQHDSGRGLWLIEQLCDEFKLECEYAYNQAILRFSLADARASIEEYTVLES
jgi:phosphoserine phosphatase RsbU/P